MAPMDSTLPRRTGWVGTWPPVPGNSRSPASPGAHLAARRWPRRAARAPPRAVAGSPGPPNLWNPTWQLKIH